MKKLNISIYNKKRHLNLFSFLNTYPLSVIKKTVIIPLLCFWTSLAFSQDRIYRHYATQEVNTRILQENPHLVEVKSNIERHVHNYVLVGGIPKVTIPVIFHVLYSSTENKIDRERILIQLNQLNRDFTVAIADLDQTNFVSIPEYVHPAESLANFELKKATEVGIGFCLATLKDTELSSINYHQVNTLEWKTDDALKSSIRGGIDGYETQNYLNIWIVNLEGEKSGYAQMPGGILETDGIVIDMDYISNPTKPDEPYRIGRTLTHLVGSYLGLYELWNEENPCQDDYVRDTPIHNAPNYGPTNRYKHISLCNRDYPVEMSMNFMDNSDDSYTYIFTKGQMIRMQAMLSDDGPRNELIKSESACTSNFNSMAESRNIKELDKLKMPKINIRPNPAKEFVIIDLEGKMETAFVSIYSSTGQLMSNKPNISVDGQESLQIDLQGWMPGIYFIHLNLDGINHNYSFSVIK